MKIYNNTNPRNTTAFIAAYNFTFNVLPVILLDQGYILDTAIYPAISSVQPVNTLSIYFQTTKKIPKDSYVVVKIPGEIQLGNSFDATI